MLAKLWIKNFALIQELRVDFSEGYTVITGETGSGKSILLGALNLILGDRADFSLIGPDSDKTFVEAEFSIEQLDLKEWFVENDIDYEKNSLVRREINASGRSRAFINDTPVSLSQIKQFTERLVNINSQHNTLALRDKNFHLELLDVLSGLELQRIDFSQLYRVLQEKKKHLKNQIERLNQEEKDKDYLIFQVEELEGLNLETINYAVIESELQRQENMEELTSTLSAISDGLLEDGSVLDLLKTIANQLNRGLNTDGKIEELSSRIQSTIIEMEDVAEEASKYLENLEKDPSKIIELTTKLDGFNRVAQKHKCGNQEELIDLQVLWKSKIQHSIEGREEVDILIREIEGLEVDLIKRADVLHAIRTENAATIEKKLIDLLADLKMPGTQLKFEIEKTDQIQATGISKVSLQFSSNAGIPLQAMDKIASGGELSRLMLTIQYLISEKKALPTIIFDEIDTGVSGEVAQKIGQLLRKMGENRQLIAISHLPQVAGKANAHIKVEKSETAGRVQSKLIHLNQKERIEEIARLMSGEKINEAALMNAQNLMEE